uniref:Uncharacterized protein n=1 Tax=Rangifer tarandus platyrhynchus TaxID=3082113 RepID=A0ACB0F8F5_RANTA|nr:unnamed protein product [Rangifer tarandus platyrhynchus]
MLTVEWSLELGWEKPCIKPLQNLSLHPGSSAFHYAVELFEGLKAFRGVDNKIRLFRPNLNMDRMYRSAMRATLPAFDKKELLECIRQLVKLDEEWVPYSTSASLYIRPTFIGTEPSLGVKKPTKALLFVILSPVGPYFSSGSFNPVSLWANPKYVRAWKGGTGDCKMGGNYGSSLFAQCEAVENACQQVLWLYGEDNQITEVGTMNLFLYWINEDGEEELATPPLDGITLPGVTRQSILDLAHMWGEFKVSERYLTMDDLTTAVEENRVREMFGSASKTKRLSQSASVVGGYTSERHFLDFDLRGRERGAEPGEARAAPEAEAEAVSPPCTPPATGATSWGFGRPQSERPRDRGSGTLRAPARSRALPTCPRAPESLAGYVQRVPYARGCEVCEVTDERRGDRGRPPFLVRVSVVRGGEEAARIPDCRNAGASVSFASRERWVFSAHIIPGTPNFPVLICDLRGRERGAEPGEARAAPEAEEEAVSPPCTPPATGATSWGFGRPQSERPRDRISGTLRAPARSRALPTCPRAPESLAGFVQRVPCARGCEEVCEVTDERRGDRDRPPFLVRVSLSSEGGGEATRIPDCRNAGASVSFSSQERWVFSAHIIPGTPNFPVGLKWESPFCTTSLASPVQLQDTAASEGERKNCTRRPRRRRCPLRAFRRRLLSDHRGPRLGGSVTPKASVPEIALRDPPRPARSRALPRAPELLSGFVRRVPCARGCEEACEVTDERREDKGRPPFLVWGSLSSEGGGEATRGPELGERSVFSATVSPGSLHFPVGLKLESPFRVSSLAWRVQPRSHRWKRRSKSWKWCGSLV